MAQVQPLAWELPHATGDTKKRKLKQRLQDDYLREVEDDYKILGVPVVVQWLTNPTRNDEVAGSIPGLGSGLRIRHCHEPWCRLQMRLRSRVAVALA